LDNNIIAGGTILKARRKCKQWMAVYPTTALHDDHSSPVEGNAKKSNANATTQKTKKPPTRNNAIKAKEGT
jgi:hypothetical protein